MKSELKGKRQDSCEITVAIDGRSGTGKSTLACQLAERLGLRCLATGALYRLVAFALQSEGAPPYSRECAGERAHAVANRFEPRQLLQAALMSEPVSRLASEISQWCEVRQGLLALQRDFATGSPGAVLEGRDIGTVILPRATAKLYLVADLDVRATRRFEQLRRTGHPESLGTIRAALARRDAEDSQRLVAPLRKPEDAHLIDTSQLNPSDALEAAVKHVRACIDG